MRITDIPEIANLSTPEKILLVEDLWDSISSDEVQIAVPQSHIDELERRLKKYQAAPENLLSLEELRLNINKLRNPFCFALSYSFFWLISLISVKVCAI